MKPKLKLVNNCKHYRQVIDSNNKDSFQVDHSLKPEVAILKINSVQQIAQYLECYLSLLKDYLQIQIESGLDSLFLQESNTLKKFLEQLEDLFPTKSVVNNTMSEVEPVFVVLNKHWLFLVNQTEAILLGKTCSDQALCIAQTIYYNKIKECQKLF